MELGTNQKIWVEALKSGKYSQCSGMLVQHNSDGERYCCLGVADKLFELNPKSFENLFGSNFKEVLGLRGDNGEFAFLFTIEQNGREYKSLTEMNDDGISFEDIADFIESTPDLIFTHSV